VLYGIATDDAHDHWGADLTSISGRGWIMVRAEELSADSLLAAMGRGDFYASSGVTLTDFARDGDEYRVSIAAEEDVRFLTRFMGTRVVDGGHAIGVVLAESAENPAVYTFTGDELYVRAVVRSSRLHPRPYREGDFEQAWTQPVLRGR
jgi:hypothetical protein